jgi:hypothetical protein
VELLRSGRSLSTLLNVSLLLAFAGEYIIAAGFPEIESCRAPFERLGLCDLRFLLHGNILEEEGASSNQLIRFAGSKIYWESIFVSIIWLLYYIDPSLAVKLHHGCQLGIKSLG